MSWIHLSDFSKFLPIQRAEKGKTAIVGYSRVSTTMQAEEGQSIDAQVSNLRKYAADHGHVLKTICVDSGISGATAERPGLKMARLVLERGDIFVVPSLSRMTRNLSDALDIKKELESKGCGFVVLDLAMDLNDKMGELMFSLMNTLNQFERKEIAGRISVVMRAMSREGTLTTKPSYGYRSDGTPNHDEQRVIEWLLRQTELNPKAGPTAGN